MPCSNKFLWDVNFCFCRKHAGHKNLLLEIHLAVMEFGVVTKGPCSFHEFAAPKAGRPRKYRGLWFLSLG